MQSYCKLKQALASEILARQRADRRFRQLVEAAPSGLAMIDREGRIVLTNAQIEALFGYAPGELMGQRIEVLVPHRFRQRHAQQVGSFFADPQTRALGAGRELFGLRKDGSEFPVEIGIRPMETDEGLFVLAAVVDISERKRAERELAGYALELQRSNSELQQFAYVASHDLKEPLRMVSSYTTLLDEEYGAQLDDNARKYLRYAVDGATRMAAMIDDLLDFSRVGRGDGPVCAVELNAVVNRVLADLAVAIDEAGAKIDVQDLPTVSGNPLRLGQLFQNLMGNAVKFRGARAPQVQVSCQRREKMWEFRVADNGIGIPAEFLDRVFQLFQRLHTHDEYPGNGIGLAVCKKIVEHHGGQIWARSQPGLGTTLFFTLPAVE
jgi:PAS domain S-box-containing protein